MPFAVGCEFLSRASILRPNFFPGGGLRCALWVYVSISDIGILNSPLDIVFLLARFGGPSLLVDAVIGALLCRCHHVIGGLTEHGS